MQAYSTRKRWNITGYIENWLGQICNETLLRILDYWEVMIYKFLYTISPCLFRAIADTNLLEGNDLQVSLYYICLIVYSYSRQHVIRR
jgi:hypothetical protein